MKKILDVHSIYIYADGTTLEYPKNQWEKYSKFKSHKKKMGIEVLFWGQKLIYEDGSEWTPLFSEDIQIINKDRTEFLVIFGEEPSHFSQIKEAPWYFPPPDNAAIYYSDGTLKHQITIPRNADGNFIFTEAGHSVKYPHLKTVILEFTNPKINKGGWYNLYAIDPDIPELIHTGQMIKW